MTARSPKIHLEGLLMVFVLLGLLYATARLYQDNQSSGAPRPSEAFFIPMDFTVHPGDAIPICVQTLHKHKASEVKFTVSAGRIVSHVGNSPSMGLPQVLPRIWCWVFQGKQSRPVTVSFWLDGQKIAKKTFFIKPTVTNV